jgi:hypothetical protein
MQDASDRDGASILIERLEPPRADQASEHFVSTPARRAGLADVTFRIDLYCQEGGLSARAAVPDWTR